MAKLKELIASHYSAPARADHRPSQIARLYDANSPTYSVFYDLFTRLSFSLRLAAGLRTGTGAETGKGTVLSSLGFSAAIKLIRTR